MIPIKNINIFFFEISKKKNQNKFGIHLIWGLIQ